MHIYDLTVPQLSHTLRNLDRWLGLAATHALNTQADPATLLHARLAPDQYVLVRQVQTACDNAKLIPARLAGKEAPPHPDTETTFEQLRARVATVLGYLETFQRADFDDVTGRKITLPSMQPGSFLTAENYVVQFALPNFYFHLVTAYSILRHAGVKLGKIDFIGPIAIQQS
jgi:uncharacterized protein